MELLGISNMILSGRDDLSAHLLLQYDIIFSSIDHWLGLGLFNLLLLTAWEGKKDS